MRVHCLEILGRSVNVSSEDFCEPAEMAPMRLDDGRQAGGSMGSRGQLVTEHSGEVKKKKKKSAGCQYIY